MAWDCYVFLEGITGEVTRPEHKGWMPVKSYTFGGSSAITSQPGSPVQMGSRSNLTPFIFTKKADLSSIRLYEAACNNQKFESATFTHYRSGTKTPVKFFEIRFKQVAIQDYSLSADDGGDGVPWETISLYFNEIEVEYFGVDPMGNQSGGDTIMYSHGDVEIKG
jgi:type VI secretion system Hcp family effector